MHPFHFQCQVWVIRILSYLVYQETGLSFPLRLYVVTYPARPAITRFAAALFSSFRNPCFFASAKASAGVTPFMLALLLLLLLLLLLFLHS